MKYLISTICFSLLLVACTNEISFSPTDETPTFIVNALLNANKHENKIVLALTGSGKVTYIRKDATIKVFVNNVLKEEINEVTHNKNTSDISTDSYLTTTFFSPGDLVRIEATALDGKYHAWSEVKVPEQINIENVDTTSSVINTNYSSLRYLHFRVTFTDPGKNLNYYRIGITRTQTVEAISTTTERDTTIVINGPETLISREDVVLTDGRPTPINSDNIFDAPENKYGVFDNSRIEGKYTMAISINYYPYSQDIYYGVHKGLKNIKKVKMSATVALHSIQEAAYYYFKALNRIDSESYDSPFVEPVKLPSNVMGGTGIFSISTETERTLELDSYVPTSTTSSNQK